MDTKLINIKEYSNAEALKLLNKDAYDRSGPLGIHSFVLLGRIF